jgi:hypothetical protein
MEGAQLVLRSGDGHEGIAHILDISPSGVAFHCDFELKLGDRVEIARQRATIARLFEGGAAANFT